MLLILPVVINGVDEEAFTVERVDDRLRDLYPRPLPNMQNVGFSLLGESGGKWSREIYGKGERGNWGVGTVGIGERGEKGEIMGERCSLA